MVFCASAVKTTPLRYTRSAAVSAAEQKAKSNGMPNRWKAMSRVMAVRLGRAMLSHQVAASKPQSSGNFRPLGNPAASVQVPGKFYKGRSQEKNLSHGR